MIDIKFAFTHTQKKNAQQRSEIESTGMYEYPPPAWFARVILESEKNAMQNGYCRDKQ